MGLGFFDAFWLEVTEALTRAEGKAERPPRPVARKPRGRTSPPASEASKMTKGALAQLGERLICIQEVVGSIPSGSTNFFERLLASWEEVLGGFVVFVRCHGGSRLL